MSVKRTLPIIILIIVLTIALVALRSQLSRPVQAEMPTTAPTALAVVASVTVPSLPTATPSATLAPTFTPNHSPTPGPSLTPSRTPTQTPSPTNTPIPSITPTSRPQIDPTIANFDSSGSATPSTAIPTAVPTFDVPGNITNILLLGADTDQGGGARTDTIIVVSINQETETAAMLSIPRDLYVYIPGWTMNRINTAMVHGQAVGYPGGGIAQLKDTIQYNFGIPIHYYAQVDFDGFKQGVNAIGGVEVAVSCQLRDWRLISPELDPQDEDNWEMFTLEPGVHMMDGDMALWYVRSRRSSSDWDRGRRQQQMLRAAFNQGINLNLLPEVPTLYNTYHEAVSTDLDIGRILQLAALAPAVHENGIQHLYLAGKTVAWTVPTSGAQVQLPIWEGTGMMGETFQRLFLPPALTQASRDPVLVEVVNHSGFADNAYLAADNLAWYGFVPVITEVNGPVEPQTDATYYSANFKGSYDWLLAWIMSMYTGQIDLVSDVEYAYDYRVVLGQDYDPCLNQLFAPMPNLPEE